MLTKNEVKISTLNLSCTLFLELYNKDKKGFNRKQLRTWFSLLALRQKNRFLAPVLILGDNGFPLRFPTRLFSHSHRFSFVGKDEKTNHPPQLLFNRLITWWDAFVGCFSSIHPVRWILPWFESQAMVAILISFAQTGVGDQWTRALTLHYW